MRRMSLNLHIVATAHPGFPYDGGWVDASGQWLPAEMAAAEIIEEYRPRAQGATTDPAGEDVCITIHQRDLPRTRVHIGGRRALGSLTPEQRVAFFISTSRRASAIAMRCKLAGDAAKPPIDADAAAAGTASITANPGPPDGPPEPEHALIACRRIPHVALLPRRVGVALRAVANIATACRTSLLDA